MRPKRCTACDRQWFGSTNICPSCGEPRPARHGSQPPAHPNLKNVLWVAVAVTLLIVLLKMT